MPNNRHEDTQMTLNFEQVFAPIGATVVQADTNSPTPRPNLQLVVDNSPLMKLSPNSAEITRLLAAQAQVLRW